MMAVCSNCSTATAAFTKTIHYNSKNNLLIFFTSSDLSTIPPLNHNYISEPCSTYLSSETTDLHDNISPIQQKLLLKHTQMGHLNMAKIQQLAKDGIFGPSFKAISTGDPPLCKACLHGKQQKRPFFSADLQPLDSSHLVPGDCISGIN